MKNNRETFTASDGLAGRYKVQKGKSQSDYIHVYARSLINRQERVLTLSPSNPLPNKKNVLVLSTTVSEWNIITLFLKAELKTNGTQLLS